MARPSKYPRELRERAVRMVGEVRANYGTEYEAIRSVAGRLGIGSPETLRQWVRRVQVDTGARPGVTGAAAMACSRANGTYLAAKYRRIAARRGPQKANVAVQHAMLVAIWNMGTNGAFYDDPGGDYFARLKPDHTRNRAIHQLEALGYTVTLEQAS